MGGQPQFLSLTLGKTDGFDNDYIKRMQEASKATEDKKDDKLAGYLSDYSKFTQTKGHKNASLGDYLNTLDEEGKKSAAETFGATFTSGANGAAGTFADDKNIGNDVTFDAEKGLSFQNDKNQSVTIGYAKNLDPKNKDKNDLIITNNTANTTTELSLNDGSNKVTQKKEGNTVTKYENGGRTETTTENGITTEKKYDKKDKLTSFTESKKEGTGDNEQTITTSYDTEKPEDKKAKQVKIQNKDKSYSVITTEGALNGQTGEGQFMTVRTYDADGNITGTKQAATANDAKTPLNAENAKKFATEAAKDDKLKIKGTAQEGNEDLKDATFVDKNQASKLLKTDKKLQETINGLEITKEGSKKPMTEAEVKKAIANGDLEVYQNEDGEYAVVSSKTKPAKEGEEAKDKYSIDAKKDPMTKMMESFMGDGSDPMKMMMGMMMMQMMTQMMGGGQAGMNPMMQQFASMLGGAQGGRPEMESAGQAFANRGIVSWFDGSSKSKERMAYKEFAANQKTEKYEMKARLAEQKGDAKAYDKAMARVEKYKTQSSDYHYALTGKKVDPTAETQSDKEEA